MDSVAVLAAAYAHMNDTGSAALHLMAEDVEWFNAAEAPQSEPYLGHAGVERWIDDYGSALTGFRADMLSQEEVAPGVVVALTRLSGRGAETGMKVELDLWTTWLVRDGLIRRAYGFMSEAEARSAASGLR